MPLHVPTFLKRTGSSVVFVAIMLTGLLWNEWSFLALVCLINFLCLGDYCRLIQKIDKETRWPGWLGIAFQLISISALLYFTLQFGRPEQANNAVYGYAGWLVYPAILLPAILLPVSAMGRPPYMLSVFRGILGLAYISLPLCLLFFMYKIGPYLPLILICMIWSNDTMAYLVGSFIGKTPFSKISPKKTWEGTLGGALITIAAAGVTGYFVHQYKVMDWIALALCATVAGTLGDLLESKLKRMADVKDSGALMPGHGGALDRFDSLLIATPFAFVYVFYFMR